MRKEQMLRMEEQKERVLVLLSRALPKTDTVSSFLCASEYWSRLQAMETGLERWLSEERHLLPTLVTKIDDLNLIPGTNTAKVESQLPQAVTDHSKPPRISKCNSNFEKEIEEGWR